MAIALIVLAVSYAALCIWLTVRIDVTIDVCLPARGFRQRPA
jgi:hypothetical protein